MAKYCDSELLELNWFRWLVAKAVPSLEYYRRIGVLWTNVVGTIQFSEIQSSKVLKDPRYPYRLHCLTFEKPIYFESVDGEIVTDLPLDLTFDQQVQTYGMPSKMDLSKEGYYREPTADASWQYVLEDIWKMCRGIATKFGMPTDEQRDELAHEALMQVVSKMVRGKLVYTPGRAPVFNLLTTTIHRCMSSVLSKDVRRRKNCQKHAAYVMAQQLKSLASAGGSNRHH